MGSHLSFEKTAVWKMNCRAREEAGNPVGRLLEGPGGDACHRQGDESHAAEKT